MSSPRNSSRAAAYVAVLLALCVGSLVARSANGADHDAQALQEFQNRIQQYMLIHHHADTVVPHIKPTHSAQKIIDRRHALAAEITKERGAAKEGNIFNPAIDAYFDRLIHAAYQANTRGIDASFECANPIREEQLKPNDVYPEGVGYTIMPSTILLHVPELPPELEYRIINKDLVIRDREANLIVDILRNAVTPPAGRQLCDD